MSSEKDPNGMERRAPGAKMDAGKAPISQGVLQYFPLALEEVAMISLVGSKKYSWKGWEKVPDGFNRYSDALGRHLLAEVKDGPYDSDTGRLHAGQVAWNALARLELYLREQDAKTPPKPFKPGAVIPTDDPITTSREYLVTGSVNGSKAPCGMDIQTFNGPYPTAVVAGPIKGGLPTTPNELFIGQVVGDTAHTGKPKCQCSVCRSYIASLNHVCPG